MIILAATGGTVAGVVDATGTYRATQGAAALLTALGDGPEDVFPRDILFKLSFEVTLAEWLGLISRLKEWNADPRVSGIVVSQGTALLEEVPFLASLFVAAEKPIVFTGSMLPLARRGTDALLNLADSIAVARDLSSRGYGSLVVMNRQIFDPAQVVKMHRSSPATLVSTGAGLLGEVDSAGVHWLAPPRPRRPSFAEPVLAAPVPIIKAGLGMDETDLAILSSTELRGVVVEGFPGGGGVPASWATPLLTTARSIPVILTSRALGGRIGAAAGGSSGGGTLLAGGLLDGGALAPVRARLLAMAAIANSAGKDPIAAVRTACAHANSI